MTWQRESQGAAREGGQHGVGGQGPGKAGKHPHRQVNEPTSGRRHLQGEDGSLG